MWIPRVIADITDYVRGGHAVRFCIQTDSIMNPVLNGCKIFVRRSEMRGTRRHLQRFHEDPGALQRLIPPLLQMLHFADGRNSLTEGNVEFRIGPGPLASRWLVRQDDAAIVLKAHVYDGGCAGTFLHRGHRFDAGATVAGGFQSGGPRCGLSNLRLVGDSVFPGSQLPVQSPARCASHAKSCVNCQRATVWILDSDQAKA